MDLIFWVCVAAIVGPFAFAGHRRARAAQSRKLSAGGHLPTFDPGITPRVIRMMAGVEGVERPLDPLERQLLEAERAHLRAELATVRAEQLVPPEPVIDNTNSSDVRFAITFQQDEPRFFDEYLGQAHIIRPLKAAVAALQSTQRVIGHCLFTGLPGRGKTLLAKVLGHELQRRSRVLGLKPVPFFETFAANLDSVTELDDVVRRIQEEGGGVWFIDEIHVLPHDLSTKLFALMQDGKYPFYGDATATAVPDVMIVAATTDYGKLHAALKRRFGEPHMVRPMAERELVALVEHRTFPIERDAAELLIARTHWSGAPYEALGLRAHAEIFARAKQAATIAKEHVEEVFDVFEIDRYGLRWMDREVLRTLFRFPRFRNKGAEFVCYAASERDVCATAGLDPDEYRETIKPRLLARRLLEIRAGYGQSLTEHGAELYKSLMAA